MTTPPKSTTGRQRKRASRIPWREATSYRRGPTPNARRRSPRFASHPLAFALLTLLAAGCARKADVRRAEERLETRLAEMNTRVETLESKHRELQLSLHEVEATLNERIATGTNAPGSLAMPKRLLSPEAPPEWEANVPVSTMPELGKEWYLVPSAEPSPPAIQPGRMVAVAEGVWFGPASGSPASPIGFVDLSRAEVTVLLQGGVQWAAMGTEALTLTPDLRSVLRIGAAQGGAGRLNSLPATVSNLQSVACDGIRRFYLGTTYGPVASWDPQGAKWESIPLAYVRDADFEKFGENYYTPTLVSFLADANGDIWGLQGTHDGTRGNAAAQYVAAKKSWQHYPVPSGDFRIIDYGTAGITSSHAWFASWLEDSFFILNRATRQWRSFQPELPRSRTSPFSFGETGIRVACGNRVYELDQESFDWISLPISRAFADITAVAERDRSLYLSTASELIIDRAFRTEGSRQRAVVPWKTAARVKSYCLVLAPAYTPGLGYSRRLVEACRSGQTNEVDSLLQSGADANGTTDPTGLTPLHMAVSSGRRDVAAMLLRYQAHVNPRTTGGLTPLALAEINRQPDMAALLRSKGGTR